MKKIFIPILATALIFVGCSKENKTNNETPVIYNLQDGPQTIDPQLTGSIAGLQIDALCMEGLLRMGRKAGEIYAAGAEKWEVSKDGKTWTFHLRKNAKWSNGEPITSSDYLFGFKRALSAQTGAQYAYMLFCVKNAEDYTKGKIKDFNKVGIKAPDKNILQITLSAPVPYFDQILTFAVTYPVNEKFYNKVKSNFALDKESLLYNGPYVIEKWIPDGQIDFLKNQNYWKADKIKINRITCPMIRNKNTAANMYRNNELDITNIAGSQLPLFKNNEKEIHKVPDSVWFLQFNITNKYLKNAKIRRAIALAINRKTFCEDIRKDGSIPAHSFVLPDINGGTSDGNKISFRDKYNKPYFTENISLAKKLLAEGLKELGIEKLPPIKLLTSNNDESRRDGQYIQEELRKNLGIDIQIDANTFKNRLQKTRQMDYEIVYKNWFPDYNDPNNFLDIWVSYGINSDTGWKNKEYDKLIIEAAQIANDDNKRMELMHKAETILMQEMPVAPLFFRTGIWLVKPDIKNLVIRGFGVQVSFIWAEIKK